MRMDEIINWSECRQRKHGGLSPQVFQCLESGGHRRTNKGSRKGKERLEREG